MATAAEIQRIAALTAQLTQLASRRRGDLIEAAHWNVVVGAVVEIARSVIADRSETVPPHDHPDQVSAGWLDPVLRARIEKGPLADPASVARVAKVERGLDGLRRSLDDVHTGLSDMRSITARVEGADLERKASLTRLARRVEGLGDARADVSDVRATLEILRTDLDRVSTFARDLDIDGEVVSVAGLIERIRDLEGLRARLTGPNGEEFNATALELRLSGLTETLVTEAELDQAFADRGNAGISDELRSQLLDASRLAAREQIDASAPGLESRLGERIAARLADVEGVAARAASTRAEEIVETLGATLRTELAGQVAAGDQALRDGFDAAVAAVRSELGSTLDARIDAVNDSLGRSIDERIGSRLPGLTAELEASLAALSAELRPLGARVNDLQRAVNVVSGTAEALRRDLDRRSSELAASLRRDLDAGIERAIATAQVNIGAIANTLRAEFAAERLRVDNALDGLRKQVPRLIESGVADARNEILSAVTREIDRLGNELNTRVDRRIDVTVASEIERRNIGNVVVPPPRRPR